MEPGRIVQVARARTRRRRRVAAYLTASGTAAAVLAVVTVVPAAMEALAPRSGGYPAVPADPEVLAVAGALVRPVAECTAIKLPLPDGVTTPDRTSDRYQRRG